MIIIIYKININNNNNNKLMLEITIIDIINKYLSILEDYNIYFLKNIKINKDKIYLELLYLRGIKIIENIFNISILYLDNLSEIYNLCIKGYIYFIEFINQINISENDKLELTIKDAIIFCYKKTIFNFENKIELYKNYNDKFLKIYNEFCIIINKLYIKFFNDIFINNDLNNDLNNDYKNINLEINNICKYIIKELNIENYNNLNIDYLINIKNLINIFENMNNKLFINLIEKIIQKKKYLDNSKYNNINLYLEKEEKDINILINLF